jgi:hypothetical protein
MKITSRKKQFQTFVHHQTTLFRKTFSTLGILVKLGQHMLKSEENKKNAKQLKI